MRLPTKIASPWLLSLAAAGLAACGGGGDAGGRPASGASSGDQAAELQHIHGLGVNPRSGALVIATHTGLFQAAEGQTRVTRMGESRQDVMGFSVVGPNRFIGSGHPDPTQNLPPNLGLIESRDGGRTWKSISLSGDADFHVLRSAGTRVYGFDGTQGRLMVSRDGGRSWSERRPPAAMFDLAIDPRSSDRIVASTERGLFRSPDGGRSWRALRGDVAGLLAWPTRGELYLVGAEGDVTRSSDGGRSFNRVGDAGGQPAAFVGEGGQLYAALGDGTVRRSADGGASWKVRATP